jgi:hypothetical protein
MSKLFSKRESLAAAIVAADIGWTAEQIVLKRQTDLWNDVSTAIASAKHGCVLHLGFPAGESADDDELEIRLNMTLTIITLPQVVEGEVPEEDLWEDLVRFVHNLELDGAPFSYRLKFKSFADTEYEADGISYLGRQTVFEMNLSL